MQIATEDAELNYLAASVAPSLRRNGAVLTRRDAEGNDAGTEGVLVDKRSPPILNGRDPDARLSLHANGFEVLDQPLTTRDPAFLDHAWVVDQYYDACADVVRDATGGARVLPFDHNVRSASGKSERAQLAGGQQVQGPAHIVHGDYTLTSAPERLGQLAQPPRLNDTYAHRLAPDATLVDPDLAAAAIAGEVRFAIINLWRNIAPEPVATRPLALCDGRSVSPEDLVVFELHYADRIGENYFARYAEDHRWFTWPGLTRDEALLIKQWDSAGTLATSEGARADHEGDDDAPCTFSFHSAFKDPSTPSDAPDRWSIEVRCLVLYG